MKFTCMRQHEGERNWGKSGEMSKEPQRGDTMNNPQWSAAELGVGKHHKSLGTPEGFNYWALQLSSTPLGLAITFSILTPGRGQLPLVIGLNRGLFIV